jgi:hypothetical protein
VWGWKVAIGRASQPFPRSKRRGRLSPHSAVQLGRTTLVGQRRLNDHKAPQQLTCRPLLSALPLLTIIWFGVPWRTCTLSRPLPPGLWLLRRRRPPARPRACARPPPGGETGLEVPRSTPGAERVPSVPARRRVVSGTTGASGDLAHQPPAPFGSGVSPRFPCPSFPPVYHRFLASPSDTGLVGPPLLVSSRRPVVRKLPPLPRATWQRRLRSPYAVVQAQLLLE